MLNLPVVLQTVRAKNFLTASTLNVQKNTQNQQYVDKTSQFNLAWFLTSSILELLKVSKHTCIGNPKIMAHTAAGT